MPLFFFFSLETQELALRLNSVSFLFTHWASEQSHKCVKQTPHPWAVSSALDVSFWVLGGQGEPTLLCLFLQLSITGCSDALCLPAPLHLIMQSATSSFWNPSFPFLTSSLKNSAAHKVWSKMSVREHYSSWGFCKLLWCYWCAYCPGVCTCSRLLWKVVVPTFCIYGTMIIIHFVLS